LQRDAQVRALLAVCAKGYLDSEILQRS